MENLNEIPNPPPLKSCLLGQFWFVKNMHAPHAHLRTLVRILNVSLLNALNGFILYVL